MGECRFQIDLKFFNGSNEEIIIDRVSGQINVDNIPSAFLPTPRLEERRLSPKIAPLTEFFVTLDQHVPKEWAIQIADYLESGKPLSLNLTKLSVIFRCVDSVNTFTAPLWQGITCTKKSNEIAIGQVVYMSVGETVRVNSVSNIAR